MRPESPNCCRLKKWQWRHNFHHCVIVKFFDIVLFLLSSLITGIRFISISSLILDLWQFPFIKDWAEIEKSEILPSEFFQIYGDWGELGISSLARVSLIKKKKKKNNNNNNNNNNDNDNKNNNNNNNQLISVQRFDSHAAFYITTRKPKYFKPWF